MTKTSQKKETTADKYISMIFTIAKEKKNVSLPT